MAFEFENTRYPELNLASVAGRVKFHGGKFATEDKALADALAALPEWYGIRLVSAPAEEQEPQEPTAPPVEDEPAPAEEPKPAPRGRRKGGDA